MATAAERPCRAEDFSAWYNYVVQQADLAEHSAVRGCMVIKPNGYAIWERMQQQLDAMFKATGHRNAYFPLFIPKSHLQQEAKHVEGFAPECAVVTHYRLRSKQGQLELDSEAQLEEPLVVRPTSETTIWHCYRQWIQSHRDLPLLLNQWANVVRWEMRTRLFLRTTEFLWQEGHTAHATAEEAQAETERMLGIYASFVEDHMAIPVLKGRKSEKERFAGAEETYCVEALMQDGRALQAGTSHFLGQNFARAFGVQYANTAGELEYVWGTSWGVSTRLMGALIMAHGDDHGLVLPPRLAPVQVVIVPIYRSDDEKQAVEAEAQALSMRLQQENLRVHYDGRDKYKPGWKFAEYELQGVPLRLALGPRDLSQQSIEVAFRDTREKHSLPRDQSLGKRLKELLDEMQQRLFDRALKFQEAQTFVVNDYKAFKARIEQGGLVLAHWDGTTETETLIQEETRATLRCIPFGDTASPGRCVRTQRPSQQRVVFARAY